MMPLSRPHSDPLAASFLTLAVVSVLLSATILVIATLTGNA